MEKNQIKYRALEDDPDGMRYELLKEYVYEDGSGETSTIPIGRKSDGATGARDLGAEETGWRKYWAKIVAYFMHTGSNKKTAAWFVHDELCIKGCWDSGVKISNAVCSTVLSSILWRDGYRKEAVTWWFATFLGGGGEARKNGMFWVRK